jgi:hypothetical protein
VRAAEPRAEVPLARRRTPDDRSCELLRTVAGPDELARAAETLDGGFPSLARLLRRAAGR